jgi:hypothetical protein
VTDPIVNALDTFVAAFPVAKGSWQEVIAAASPADVVTGRRSWYLPRPRSPRSRRSIVAVLVVVAALAVASVAIAIANGSLFGIVGISNPGKPVTGGFDLVHALPAMGAKPGSLVELRASGGYAVYAARERKHHHVCLFFGQAASHPDASGSCLGIHGLRGAAFPSRSLPVWDMSIFGLVIRHGVPLLRATPLRFFVGVAADGVRSVQLLATSDCHVVDTAPVINNVYMDVHPPQVPVSYIVARNAAGKIVWHEKLRGGKKPLHACGLR